MRNRGKHSFVQFYPDHWQAGTARMPRLVRSVYFDICLYTWDKARPVPSATLRLMLADMEDGQGQRIVDALVEEGTLILNPDNSVHSPRALAEAEKAAAAWAAKSRGGRTARGSGDEEEGKSDAAKMQESCNNDAADRDRDRDREDSPNGESIGKVGPKEIAEAWNEMAQGCGLSQIVKITAERVKRIKARLEEHGGEALVEAIKTIPDEPFLLGRSESGWKATFDWLLAPKYCAKLIEGGYHNRGKGPGSAWTG